MDGLSLLSHGQLVHSLFAPGPIRSRERIGPGAKRLGTITVMVIFLDKTLLPYHKDVHECEQLARVWVVTRQWNICVSMPQNLERQFCWCRNSCGMEMQCMFSVSSVPFSKFCSADCRVPPEKFPHYIMSCGVSGLYILSTHC